MWWRRRSHRSPTQANKHISPWGQLHASKYGPCAPTPKLMGAYRGLSPKLGPDLWALTGGTRLIPPNFLGVVRLLFRGRTDHILRHAGRPQWDSPYSDPSPSRSHIASILRS